MTDRLSEIPDNWSVTRLSAALGAEIRGPELAAASAKDCELIKALLLQHKVIFFPAQRITPAEHIAFGRHFGHLEGHPNLAKDSEAPPEIFELRATSGGIADEWHTDLTFQEHPALLSILHMVNCPDTGGDTQWSNLNAAYEALSQPMQSLCAGLTALHDALPHNHPEQTAIHPVVRVHPQTRERLLYVNEHFTRRIVEMNAPESEVLLRYLTRWVADARFTVRYNWTPGTIAMWDNCCTQHCVVNDFEGERLIQRVTVVGDEVEAAQAPQWQPWSGALKLSSAASRHDRQLHMHLKSKNLLPQG
jgi:taurine dioxygenase